MAFMSDVNQCKNKSLLLARVNLEDFAEIRFEIFKFNIVELLYI